MKELGKKLVISAYSNEMSGACAEGDVCKAILKTGVDIRIDFVKRTVTAYTGSMSVKLGGAKFYGWKGHQLFIVFRYGEMLVFNLEEYDCYGLPDYPDIAYWQDGDMEGNLLTKVDKESNDDYDCKKMIASSMEILPSIKDYFDKQGDLVEALAGAIKPAIPALVKHLDKQSTLMEDVSKLIEPFLPLTEPIAELLSEEVNDELNHIEKEKKEKEEAEKKAQEEKKLEDEKKKETPAKKASKKLVKKDAKPDRPDLTGIVEKVDKLHTGYESDAE